MQQRVQERHRVTQSVWVPGQSCSVSAEFAAASILHSMDGQGSSQQTALPMTPVALSGAPQYANTHHGMHRDSPTQFHQPSVSARAHNHPLSHSHGHMSYVNSNSSSGSGSYVPQQHMREGCYGYSESTDVVCSPIAGRSASAQQLMPQNSSSMHEHPVPYANTTTRRHSEAQSTPLFPSQGKLHTVAQQCVIIVLSVMHSLLLTCADTCPYFASLQWKRRSFTRLIY